MYMYMYVYIYILCILFIFGFCLNIISKRWSSQGHCVWDTALDFEGICRDMVY